MNLPEDCKLYQDVLKRLEGFDADYREKVILCLHFVFAMSHMLSANSIERRLDHHVDIDGDISNAFTWDMFTESINFQLMWYVVYSRHEVREDILNHNYQIAKEYFDD